ncbi:MAG: DUF4445 domain-containing protein [Sedimentisphaerales bacterium]|nr:DUF4445 domain-containing protein [Sedimentisphaerales bacterium]
MQHHTVRFLPDDRTVSIHRGATLFEAAAKAGVILNAVCGGGGTCGKCVVRIADQEGLILACQTIVEKDLLVTVPQESRFYKHQILGEGIERETAPMPSIRKIFVRPSGFTKQALTVSLQGREMNLEQIDEVLLKDLEKNNLSEGITVICLDRFGQNGSDVWDLIGIEAGDTTGHLYGVAVDMGTTTVVAKLLDLNSGQTLATVSEANPQIQFGDDVISRIHHAQTPTGRDQLRKSMVKCLDRLIRQLCMDSGVESVHVYEVISAGNTTMGHLLIGLPVQSLGQAPYRAFSLVPQERQAMEIGLSSMCPQGRLYTLANIAGFVGSDTTAVALAVGLDEIKKTTLVVDIGTNGELLLKSGEYIYAASCAAGPALEGARIRYGSRAMDGAIQSLVLADGDLDVDVIGGGKAHSICGSGLIDAVAILLELGILDTTGRFVDIELLQVSDAIRRRCVQIQGQPAFILAGMDGDSEKKVFLTQRDIRETQLAKGAIRAGIDLLLAQAGLGVEDLEQILLAGAFGSYIRRESAIRIGLLPSIPHDHIHFIGNAALSGAQMALLNRDFRKQSVMLAGSIRYVEIAHQAAFQNAFAEAMLF